MYYFYILSISPIGQAAIFYRNKNHPLSIEGLRCLQEDVARQMTMAARGQLISPGTIHIQSLYELSKEVVLDRWPDDLACVKNENKDKFYTDSCSGSRDTLIPTGTQCSVCNEPQIASPSGDTCKNGHGGAPPK